MRAGIAGAGVMGLLMAEQLVRAGWTVTIYDAGNDNCSTAAAGLLTPVAEREKCGRDIFTLGMKSLVTYWPQLLSRLQRNIYFSCSGSLLVSHARDYHELQRFAELTADCGEIQFLNSDDIAALEPQLRKFSRGIYLRHEGQIDSQHFMRAMMEYLTGHGVIHHQTIIKNVQPGKIFLQDQTMKFDLVIDCRGLGAKQQFPSLRAVRGELLWLHASEVNITRPVRYLHPRYGLYLVPRPDQIYLLGASEIEAEDYSPVSVRTMLELLTAANCIHPGLLEARILKTVTQCRPTLASHLPEIRVEQGLIAINGLYRHGFLIAPAIAEEVMRWISDGVINPEYQQLWEAA